MHEQGVERRELIAEVIEGAARVLGGAVAARDAVGAHGGVVDDLGGVFRGGSRLARRSPRGVVRKRRQEDNLDEDDDDEAEEVLFDAEVRVRPRLGSGRAVGDAERHDVRGESGDDARVGVVGVEPEKRAQKVEDGEEDEPRAARPGLVLALNARHDGVREHGAEDGALHAEERGVEGAADGVALASAHHRHGERRPRAVVAHDPADDRRDRARGGELHRVQHLVGVGPEVAVEQRGDLVAGIHQRTHGPLLGLCRRRLGQRARLARVARARRPRRLVVRPQPVREVLEREDPQVVRLQSLPGHRLPRVTRRLARRVVPLALLGDDVVEPSEGFAEVRGHLRGGLGVVAAPGLDGVAHRLDHDVLDGGEGTLGIAVEHGRRSALHPLGVFAALEEVPAVHLNRVQSLEGELHALEAHAHLRQNRDELLRLALVALAVLLGFGHHVDADQNLALPSRVPRRLLELREVRLRLRQRVCHPGAEHLALGRVRSPRVRGDGVFERLLEEIHDFVRLPLDGAYGGRLRGEGDDDGGEGAERGGERDPEGLPSEVEVLVDAPDADGGPAECELLREHGDAAGVENAGADEGVGDDDRRDGVTEEREKQRGAEGARDGSVDDVPAVHVGASARLGGAHDRDHRGEHGHGQHVVVPSHVLEQRLFQQGEQRREARGEARADGPRHEPRGRDRRLERELLPEEGLVQHLGRETESEEGTGFARESPAPGSRRVRGSRSDRGRSRLVTGARRRADARTRCARRRGAGRHLPS